MAAIRARPFYLEGFSFIQVCLKELDALHNEEMPQNRLSTAFLLGFLDVCKVRSFASLFGFPAFACYDSVSALRAGIGFTFPGFFDVDKPALSVVSDSG